MGGRRTPDAASHHRTKPLLLSTSHRLVRRSTNKEGTTTGNARDTSTGVTAVLVAPVRERRERSVSGADDYPLPLGPRRTEFLKSTSGRYALPTDYDSGGTYKVQSSFTVVKENHTKQRGSLEELNELNGDKNH